jgi:serine/threonine-protein kinase
MPEPTCETLDSRRASGPAASAADDAFVSLARTGIKKPVLPPGAKVGRFQIKIHLGSGGLAEVYLAYDSVRRETLAIKVVDAGPLDSEVAAALLRSEVAVLSKVEDYSHVLKVFDVHQVPWGGTELLILSMEYADGGTFRTWLKERADDLEGRRTQGVEHFKQLCQGVKALHEAGVAHLDVKPDNALFINGALKVGDFSVSTAVQSLTRRDAPVDNDGSDPGRIGTPLYMSREHFVALHGDDLDWRSDIYSLGVVLYEILDPRGRTPYAGSYTQLCKLHSTAPIPVMPDADETLARIVTRCLQKNPTARYQSVGELLDDLEGKRRDDPENACKGAESTDALWERICGHVSQRQFADARRVCHRLLEQHPDHADAKVLQDELQERYDQDRQLYTAMEQGLESIGIDSLIAMLKEAVDVFPDHPAGRVVQVRLSVKSHQYCQALESGVDAAGRREWEIALSHFEQAKRLNAGAREAEGPARLVVAILDQIRQEREWIDLAVSAGDPRRAMAVARALDEYLDEMSQRILTARESARGVHENT